MLFAALLSTSERVNGWTLFFVVITMCRSGEAEFGSAGDATERGLARSTVRRSAGAPGAAGSTQGLFYKTTSDTGAMPVKIPAWAKLI